MHFLHTNLQLTPWLSQLSQSQGGEKGPQPDPFSYLQAQVGPVGPRGPPGMLIDKILCKFFLTDNLQ